METDQSFLNPKKQRFEWRIQNFRHYFSFIDECESLTRKSKNFSMFLSTLISPCEFYFTITILSRSILCSLHYIKGYVTFSCLTCKMFLLNENNQVLKTIYSNANYATHAKEESTKLASLILCSADLLSERVDLFPDGELIIVCELIVFEENAEIERSYTLKPCQSMEDHLKELLKSEVGADMVFEVDGKEFKAHKSILLARSPVFAAMFSHDMVENNTNRVKIEDISKPTFKLLLDFIYTDEINTQLDIETGRMLLEAACKYHLDGLKNLCAKQLFKLITVNNVEEIQAIAETYDLPNLTKSIAALTKFHGNPV